MSEFKSDFLRTLAARGFIHQVTDAGALDALTPRRRPGLYRLRRDRGFAACRPACSQIMLLRWLQRCGHKPIVLMGGGTGGSATRQLPRRGRASC
jgi:tyrosyl-tRNA synthetase